MCIALNHKNNHLMLCVVFVNKNKKKMLIFCFHLSWDNFTFNFFVLFVEVFNHNFAPSFIFQKNLLARLYID